VDYRIKNATFIPQEDSDGELRILKAEVTVGLTAEATDKKNVEIVSDAYGLRSNIENERQAFKINRVVARNRSQVTLKEVVEFDGNSPIYQKCSMFCANLACLNAVQGMDMSMWRELLKTTSSMWQTIQNSRCLPIAMKCLSARELSLKAQTRNEV